MIRENNRKTIVFSCILSASQDKVYTRQRRLVVHRGTLEAISNAERKNTTVYSAGTDDYESILKLVMLYPCVYDYIYLLYRWDTE